MIKEKNFWMYVFLTLITCGLYSIYFWYVTVEDLNIMFAGDGEETPNYIIVMLLSFVTCGIYFYIWLYKMSNRLQISGMRMYQQEIQESGTTILLWMLLGSIVCGIGAFVAYYFIFINFNKVAAEYNRRLYSNRIPEL